MNNRRKYRNQIIISNILKEGGILHKDVLITSVKFTELNSYDRLTLSLDVGVNAYEADKLTNGYNIVENYFTFISFNSLLGALRTNPKICWLIQYFKDNPTTVEQIIPGATINLLQQFIPAGCEYLNPFSINTSVIGKFYDHDVYKDHIVKIELGETGQEFANIVAKDKLKIGQNNTNN